jgi:hypothetical protein
MNQESRSGSNISGLPAGSAEQLAAQRAERKKQATEATRTNLHEGGMVVKRAAQRSHVEVNLDVDPTVAAKREFGEHFTEGNLEGRPTEFEPLVYEAPASAGAEADAEADKSDKPRRRGRGRK